MNIEKEFGNESRCRPEFEKDMSCELSDAQQAYTNPFIWVFIAVVAVVSVMSIVVLF